MQKKKYWKFSADLLNLEDYVKDVKTLIKEIKGNTELDTYCRKWDFLKIQGQVLSIEFSKIKCQQQRLKELELLQEINERCRKTELPDENNAKLLSL